MTLLFALCFPLLWTSTRALSPEFSGQTSAGQLLCSETYRKVGVCKSVRYEIKHISCIVKKSTSEPVIGHESRTLTFKKVSMCVPLCDESCDGLTTASSVGWCRQNRRQGLSNKTDVYLPNLLPLTAEATGDGDLHIDQVSPNISIHQACEEGKLCLVQFMLSLSPADINTRDKLARTPVMAAVMNNQVNVFDFLVSKSCDLMAEDNNNDTVLHVASDAGNVDAVRQLVVNNTCDIESRGGNGMTPVMKSALHGHRNVFDILVRKGCNVTTLDDSMNNILHVACSGGHVDMVKYILRTLHADIESRGETGRTPALIAASNGHLGVVDFLASKGSNLSAVDDNNDNILHVACIGGQVDMVQHILNKTYMGIESRAKYGRTPVMRAAQYGHRSVVDVLVPNNCNLSAVDDALNNLLHVACIGGRLTMVKHILLKLKFAIDSQGQDGQTPVMTAVRHGHTDVVKYLVSKGCNVAILNVMGNNILHLACRYGHVGIAKYILSQTNISIDSRGYMGRTSVMYAADFGHLSVFMVLVNQGCTLTILDTGKNNILHLACMGGHVNIVKHIVENHGIGIESRGQNTQTPLMAAAKLGRAQVARYLVNKGCKLNITDDNGNNILHVACRSGSVDTVMFFLSRTGIGIDSRGQYGRTPAMKAAYCGHLSLVKYLINKGCKLSIVDSNGNSILHVACIGGSLETVKYILSRTRIGIDSRGQFGWTPAMTAGKFGHLSLAKYLIGKGCKLSIVDSNGNSILHVACMGGNLDTVKYILSRTRIEIDSRGQYGRTPVMCAACFGHFPLVKYLIGKGCELSIVDSNDHSILHLACMGGSLDTVKYILSRTKIGIDSRGQYALTPVMVAASFGHFPLVKYLIGKGCKLSIVDSNGNNILHVACVDGSLDTVTYILSRTRIGIDSRGQYARIPAMTAAYFGHFPLVKYLVGKGCKLSIVDSNGDNILHVACMGGSLDTVKYILLRTKIGIDSRGQNARTPVMVAASFGHFPLVKYLIGKGCKLSIVDSNGNNILHVACVGGSLDTVKYILSRTRIGIDSRGQYARIPAMTAAYFGHFPLVKYLVGKGCKLSIVDSNGDNILHVACMGGSLDTVKYILSRTKIGIDSRGQYARTPVMVAASFGHFPLVKYLVGKGCKLSIVDSNGENILHVACMGGNLDTVKYILSRRRIGIDCRGHYGRTPAMTAAYFGHFPLVKYLIGKGCKLSIVDWNGDNILHVACMGGSLDTVKYILSRRRIEMDSRGQYGRTPMMVAASFGQVSLVKYLINKGCKLSVVTSNGDSILHVACRSGSLDTVKYILSKTRNAVDRRGQYGRTPVMHAAYYGHTSVVKYLVTKGCKLTKVDVKGTNVLQMACMGRHEDVVKYLVKIKSWSKTCSSG